MEIILRSDASRCVAGGSVNRAETKRALCALRASLNGVRKTAAYVAVCHWTKTRSGVGAWDVVSKETVDAIVPGESGIRFELPTTIGGALDVPTKSIIDLRHLRQAYGLSHPG